MFSLQKKEWVRVTCLTKTFRYSTHISFSPFFYPDNYKSVLKAVYKYLDILRAAYGLSSAPSNSASTLMDKYHYSEIKALADIHFRFSEKVRAENYVSDVAAAMNRPYAREHILSGPARVWESNEDAVKDLLDLLKPENSRVLLMAREFPEVVNGISEGENGVWQTDKWYTTEYRVVKLDDDVMRCTTPRADSSENISELYLPGPNDFIPSALSVEKVETAGVCVRVYMSILLFFSFPFVLACEVSRSDSQFATFHAMVQER